MYLCMSGREPVNLDLHPRVFLLDLTHRKLSYPPHCHASPSSSVAHGKKAQLQHWCCSNMFSQSGFQRSRDSNNNNKRKKAAATHWIFHVSLNMNPPSDWPLTLHPCPFCQALTYATSWFDLSGERNAASKMAYYQQTISSFRNSIVKD